MSKEEKILKLSLKIRAVELLEHIIDIHKKASVELETDPIMSASVKICTDWLETLLNDKRTEVVIDTLDDDDILEDFINFMKDKDDEE